MKELLNGFLDGALWSENDEETDKPFEDSYTRDDFSEEAVKKAMDIVFVFANKVEEILGMPFDEAAYEADKEVSAMGVDLWLTLVGHGAGFWDGDWDGPWGDWGDKLTKITKTLGHLETIYADDEGELHFV